MAKTCTKCGKTKERSEFAKDKVKKDGRDSNCKACRNAHSKKKYTDDPEKFKKRAKDMYVANPEKFRQRRRDWKNENPEKEKASQARRQSYEGRFRQSLNNIRKNAKAGGYAACNATAVEIEAAFTGRCEICGVAEEAVGKKHCLDHDHDSGKFRGWLCRKCNGMLGFADDSAERLAVAAAYLIKNNQ